MTLDLDIQESYYESVIKLSKQVNKITSDGKATKYYDFPVGASTLNDIIEFKDMSFARGNIFKAAYRLGEKEGIDDIYDLNKIIYYAKRLIKLKTKRNKPTK
jgi:hypothetical protein